MSEKSLIKTLQDTIESQNKTIERLSDELKRANENMEYLMKKLYGRKTEKTSVIDGQVVMSDKELGLFNEAEKELDVNESEPDIFEKPVKKTRLGYSRKEVYKNLPTEDQVFKLEVSQQVCPVDGEKLSVAGKKFIRSEIKYIPAEISVVNIYQETYECRTCKNKGRPGMYSPSTPEPVLQHSHATASSIAWTMYQKYVQSVPLYRQEKDWKLRGSPVGRSTLSNWIIKSSEEWLYPVATKLQEELLKSEYLHADETPVQVLNEDGKKNTTKSYMWVYSTSVNSDRKIRLFEYSTGRSGENAKNFLKGFSGYLHTDAYSGYKKVEGVNHCFCWAHVRRYFSDALPKNSESPDANIPSKGIAYCNKLFDLERKFQNLSSEDRRNQRLEKEKPILEAFWLWAEKTSEKVLPKSKISTALQYALNNKEYLETYLEDGDCVISNNIAENSIRPFTVGRKNWMFCGSPSGAKASACVYSLVETAKANGLNPYKYLEYILSILPGSSLKTNPKVLELMMPWDELVQKTCK